MFTTIIVMTLAAATAVQSNAQAARAGSSPERTTYWCQVSGFALADSADGETSSVAWDEIDVARFARIYVFTNVPESVLTLQRRYRALLGKSNKGGDVDLGPGNRVSNQSVEFILQHSQSRPNAIFDSDR